MSQNEDINPNDEGSLTGALNVAMSAVKRTTDVSLPCQVTKVNAERTRVDVLPLIKLIDKAGKTHSRAEIKDIPIVNTGGGGFLVSFNIEVGDMGWIKATDRDISIFKQSLKESPPNTTRMHSFSDAIFMPDVMSGFTIADDDSAAMTIQSKDGSVVISLSNDKIKLKHPTKIELETSDYSVTTSGKIDLNGVTIDSSGSCESPVEFKAPNVTGTTDVKAGTVSLSTHVHAAGLLISGKPGDPVTGATAGPT